MELEKKKIRILFVSHASGLCGSETSLLNLLKKIDRAKYEPLVLVPNNGLLVKELECLGVKSIVYPIQRWAVSSSRYSKVHLKEVIFGLPKRVYFLCKLIKREKIDLVYANSVLVIDDAIAAKLKHIPRICHIRNFLYNNSTLAFYFPIPLICILEYWLSSKIILVSEAVRKSYNFEKIGKYNGKVKVIHNGVDVEKFSANTLVDAEDNLRQELGLEEKTKIIALVGRYQEEKGVIEFVESAKIVTSSFPNAIFVLIGDQCQGTYNRLKALVEKFGIKNKVYFLDFRTNIVPLYRTIYALVSASWFEALSRTILEAMAAAKPVIASKCGGPQEIVIDGETGFLVPIKSHQNLAKAIIKLLNNPELAQEMGRHGQKRVIRFFSLEKHVQKIENIIDEAVKAKTALFSFIELSRVFSACIKIIIKKTSSKIFHRRQNTCIPYEVEEFPLKKLWRFAIKCARKGKTKRVYFFVEYSQSSTAIIRGYQISAQLQKNGIQSAVLDLRFEGKKIYRKLNRIKNSIIVFNKRALMNNGSCFSLLRKNRNVLIWDPVDGLIELIENKNVKQFDGIMLPNQQSINDFQQYFKKDCLLEVIHHHWDQRCLPNQAKSYSLVFVGDPTPENIDEEHIKNIEDLNIEKCNSIDDFYHLFQKVLDYSCHFSVRKRGSSSFNYKPNVKLAFASACRANIILSRDFSNLELLDFSYPYYTNSDLKSVVNMVNYTKETYQTKIWHNALAMMEEVRKKTSLENIIKKYIEFFNRF
jgi:glycosyltransferase involved in cell wall biosynthesis